MAYDNLSEFWDPSLHLPVGDKTYRVPAPTADEGLHLRAIFSDPDREVSDEEEFTLIKKVLGDTWQQMVDDGQPWPVLMHVGRTACIHYGISPQAGHMFWLRPGDVGNLPAPQETGPKTKTAKRGSKTARTANTTPAQGRTAATTPAADHTTPQPDSETGTTTPTEEATATD